MRALHRSIPNVVTSLMLALLARTAPAQCPGWSAGFGSPGASSDTAYSGNGIVDFKPTVSCTAEYQGALFIGGSFTAADDAPCNGLARWSGDHWVDVGGGVQLGANVGNVRAFAVFDDGSGPALYVAGRFFTAGGIAANHIARWNGASWSALGTGLDANGSIACLAVHDDGSGPALYAGGNFLIAGASVFVARWNGTQWTALPSTSTPPDVLASYDDGTGAKLYAGGESNLFRAWNGTSWIAPAQAPGAILGSIYDFVVADIGTGMRLHAAGVFQFAGSPNPPIGTASWDGTTWSVLGTGLPPTCRSIAFHDDGTGIKLYASGWFAQPSAHYVARFDGANWQDLGVELGDYVESVRGFDDGTGPVLIAAGRFERAGASGASGIARWNGATWSPMGRGLGLDDNVYALATFDSGSGRRLCAGGELTSAGVTRAAGVAQFDGTSWSPLGSGIQGTVRALCEYTAPSSSPALCAGGSFTQAGGAPANAIASWNGTAWSALSSGVTGPLGSGVYALVAHDDGTGPALFAGGSFVSAGGSPANNIARWNGTSWSALASGTNGAVRALCVFDDGSGAKLVAAGSFTLAGGATANSIAVWDGSTWSTLGAGASGLVDALAVFDDGSGPALYSSGYYTLPGGAQTNEIARWRNGAWESVGTGITAVAATRSVVTMLPFSDALGSVLVVGGFFSEAGGNAAKNLARWDGTSWSNYGAGADLPVTPQHTRVNALCAWDDGGGGGADLYVGGVFTWMDGKPAANIAKVRACGPQSTSYCAGDGTANACPCGNSGATGRGCANSLFASGALLSTSGIPSVSNDTIVLTAAQIPNSTAFFVQGDQRDSGGLGTPFYDGLRCVSGALIRLGSKTAIANAASQPGPTNPKISVRGSIPSAGATRHYQVLYRNAAPGFCTPQTANWTNGVTLSWYP